MSDKMKSYITVTDHLVSGETFTLRHDSDLDMLITEPKPSDSELSKYYESDAYISHTDQKKGILSFLYQMVKSYALGRKVQLANKLNGGTGTLLDIGAGTGDFLVAAKNKGWTVAGVEVNDAARSKASEKGIDLHHVVTEIGNEKFDVITMWHVLEHIPNLEETIQSLHQLLKSNGRLIIAVPNFRSHDAKYYGKFWAAYDPPRHLWHFSRTAMTKLFATSFHLEKIKPMYFDSFYVSLLSEKYKNGTSFSLRAFLVGLVSNLKA
ncbi:MAG: class I SAM-dependent methyltransferase, partial [Marinirhabdus sp.]|nr:class I SAM-dependent methyltransferase [Marinirhabdus sp.]